MQPLIEFILKKLKAGYGGAAGMLMQTWSMPRALDSKTASAGETEAEQSLRRLRPLRPRPVAAGH